MQAPENECTEGKVHLARVVFVRGVNRGLLIPTYWICVEDVVAQLAPLLPVRFVNFVSRRSETRGSRSDAGN